MPWFVFTHQELEAPVGDVTFLEGDPIQHRSRIEATAGGRDVWMVGGGGLAADFADAGMLDEVLLAIAPVTLGRGAPLLPRRLELARTEQAVNGEFVCVRYDVVRG